MITDNLEKLRRTRDGRFEAGVYIRKDERARYIATVLVPMKGLEAGQVLTEQAIRLKPELVFEVAAQKARDWALERLPAIYEFDPADLVITLMDGSEFE